MEPNRGRADGWHRSPATTVVFALVTGLAVGFAVGREVSLRSGPGGASADPTGSAEGAQAAAPHAGKVYATVAEFPADWIKDTNLSPLVGLEERQKVTVLQALNERKCECGCPFGTIANCLAKDPNCPRSPELARLAVDLVKQGKGLGEILAAIDRRQAELGGKKAAPQDPSGPVYVELAAWNPRKGPKDAKVTIVEFSDFQ